MGEPDAAAQSASRASAEPSGSSQPGGLPRLVWVGTGIFAVLAAGMLAAVLRFGKDRMESAGNGKLESKPVELPDKELDRALRDDGEGR